MQAQEKHIEYHVTSANESPLEGEFINTLTEIEKNILIIKNEIAILKRIRQEK